MPSSSPCYRRSVLFLALLSASFSAPGPADSAAGLGPGRGPLRVARRHLLPRHLLFVHGAREPPWPDPVDPVDAAQVAGGAAAADDPDPRPLLQLAKAPRARIRACSAEPSSASAVAAEGGLTRARPDQEPDPRGEARGLGRGKDRRRP
jgi:hypothetical protein